MLAALLLVLAPQQRKESPVLIDIPWCMGKSKAQIQERYALRKFGDDPGPSKGVYKLKDGAELTLEFDDWRPPRCTGAVYERYSDRPISDQEVQIRLALMVPMDITQRLVQGRDPSSLREPTRSEGSSSGPAFGWTAIPHTTLGGRNGSGFSSARAVGLVRVTHTHAPKDGTYKWRFLLTAAAKTR